MAVDTADVIDPATYATMFQERREFSRHFAGVCGRVVRGTAPHDFSMLSFFPGRRLAWLFGPDGLRSVVGCSDNEVLRRIAKSDQPWLNDRLAEGMRFKLIVMPQMECRRADWDGVFDMVEQHYPEVAGKLDRWRSVLRQASSEGLPQDLLIDAVRSDPGHSDHMSVERYRACDDTAQNARLFLRHSLGMNENYVGNGFTKPSANHPSIDEYLTANVALATIPGIVTIDLHIEPERSYM